MPCPVLATDRAGLAADRRGRRIRLVLRAPSPPRRALGARFPVARPRSAPAWLLGVLPGDRAGWIRCTIRLSAAGEGGQARGVLVRGASRCSTSRSSDCASRTRDAPIRRRSRRGCMPKEQVESARRQVDARVSRACATAGRICRTSRTAARDIALRTLCRVARGRGCLAAALHAAAKSRWRAAGRDVPWRAAVRCARRAARRRWAGRGCSPRGYHVLGTDKVGQDVLYQALKIIRTSLVIGTLTTLVLLPLGIAARHRGGLLPRLGRRRHPVRLHHAQFDPGRAADRRLAC